MKRPFNSLIILFLMCISSSSLFLFAQDLSIPKVVIKSEAKVVQIHRFNKKGESLAQGSGFFIDPEKILTCEHAVRGVYSIAVRNENNYYTRVTILKKDENSDLALLKVDGQSKEGFLLLENEQEVNQNQNIVVIGYPDDKVKFFSYGRVIKDYEVNGIHKIQTSAPTYPGMSGCPVLNLEGHVIGVHYGSIDYKKKHFAIGIKTIKKFIRLPDNPQQLPEAGSVVFYIAFKEAAIEKIDRFLRSISEFVFFHGRIRGIFIIMLSGALFFWTCRSIPKHKFWKVFQGINREKSNKRTFKFYCWRCGKKINISSFYNPVFVKCRRCRTCLEVPAV